jgi:hypothetical protein
MTKTAAVYHGTVTHNPATCAAPRYKAKVVALATHPEMLAHRPRPNHPSRRMGTATCNASDMTCRRSLVSRKTPQARGIFGTA